jgi:hypothetical protein
MKNPIPQLTKTELPVACFKSLTFLRLDKVGKKSLLQRTVEAETKPKSLE